MRKFAVLLLSLSAFCFGCSSVSVKTSATPANNIQCESSSFSHQGKCYAVGDVVQFGHYPQSSENANPEPIDWIIVEASADDFFLVSKYVIDAQSYHNDYGVGDWERASIRAWLNALNVSDVEMNAGQFGALDEPFWGKAFSDEERLLIKKMTVQHPNNEETNTKGCNDTEENVYLLSIDEANKYNALLNGLKVMATPYALSKGAPKSDQCVIENSAQYCETNWWLRSPGDRTPAEDDDFNRVEETENVAFINQSGSIESEFQGEKLGIRPVLHIAPVR